MNQARYSSDYDHDLENIVNAFIESVQPRKIILFGSRSRGEQHIDSDYDFCIILDDDRKSTMEASINANISLIGVTSQPVDIVALHKKTYEKRKNVIGTLEYDIDKEGIVLYE